MRDALLILAVITLLAALAREHRKVKELRRSLRKATKWLN